MGGADEEMSLTLMSRGSPGCLSPRRPRDDDGMEQHVGACDTSNPYSLAEMKGPVMKRKKRRSSILNKRVSFGGQTVKVYNQEEGEKHTDSARSGWDTVGQDAAMRITDIREQISSPKPYDDDADDTLPMPVLRDIINRFDDSPAKPILRKAVSCFFDEDVTRVARRKSSFGLKPIEQDEFTQPFTMDFTDIGLDPTEQLEEGRRDSFTSDGDITQGMPNLEFLVRAEEIEESREAQDPGASSSRRDSLSSAGDVTRGMPTLQSLVRAEEAESSPFERKPPSGRGTKNVKPVAIDFQRLATIRGFSSAADDSVRETMLERVQLEQEIMKTLDIEMRQMHQSLNEILDADREVERLRLQMEASSTDVKLDPTHGAQSASKFRDGVSLEYLRGSILEHAREISKLEELIKEAEDCLEGECEILQTVTRDVLNGSLENESLTQSLKSTNESRKALAVSVSLFDAFCNVLGMKIEQSSNGKRSISLLDCAHFEADQRGQVLQLKRVDCIRPSVPEHVQMCISSTLSSHLSAAMLRSGSQDAVLLPVLRYLVSLRLALQDAERCSRICGGHITMISPDSSPSPLVRMNVDIFVSHFEKRCKVGLTLSMTVGFHQRGSIEVSNIRPIIGIPPETSAIQQALSSVSPLHSFLRPFSTARAAIL